MSTQFASGSGITSSDVRRQIVQAVARELEAMPHTLSGEDSGLTNTWVEICAQVQIERSFFWDSYDEVIETLLLHAAESLPESQLALLWLDSAAVDDWSPKDINEAPPITAMDVLDDLKEALLSFASDYECRELDRYRARRDSNDDCEEDEEDDESDEEDIDEPDEVEERSLDLAPVIVITRDEVNARDTSSVVSALRSLMQSPARARQFFEQVDIAFHGYDDITAELFEIDAVRDYARALDEQFPYWLFFMDKTGSGLHCLSLCFMPPFLTKAAKQKIFPERLDALLSNRWFPAMNQICDWVGFSEDEIEALSDRSVTYLLYGPRG